MRVTLEILDTPEPGPVTVIGRDAWALLELHRAGDCRCTPLTHPGPRWSGYVHKLRKLGLRIETVTESMTARLRATMPATCCESRMRDLRRLIDADD